MEEYKAKEAGEHTLLFAHYGKAVYMAQIVEQQAINMLAIDDIMKSKPDSKEAYDAIWAKYDHSKKMMGMMTTLLQDAYHISEDDMTQLKEVLAWRNNLSHRYFRFNDVLFYSASGQKRMVRDFVDFSNSVKAVAEKLEVYVGDYNKKAGVTSESIGKLLAEKRQEWKDKVIDDTYVSMTHHHED